MTNENNKYGNGCVHKVYKAWKQKQMLEDAQLKYRCWTTPSDAKPKRKLKWIILIVLIVIIIGVILGLSN